MSSSDDITRFRVGEIVSERRDGESTSEWYERAKREVRMSDDIVDRLRAAWPKYPWADEAADEIERLQAEVNTLMDGLEYGWGVIANAHAGDWTEGSDEWQRAAARYRDEYWHPALDRNEIERLRDRRFPDEQQ